MRVKLLVFATVLTTSASVRAQDIEPLSPEVALRIAKLLEEFDPNSYSLDVPVSSGSGGVTTARLGKAVGLASLRQTSLEKELSEAALAGTNSNINIFKHAAMGTNSNVNIFRSAAGTNSNINIFKPMSAAGTNSNINIFRTAAAGTNSNINIFANEHQAAAAHELNSILSKSIAK
jgi:hypothetical protein